MTFRQFALKNIRGKRHQYTAYFFSSVFTVMIFYIYAAFIFHPDVINGTVHEGVRMLMVACEWIIIVFSFFFVMYSNSAFLKSRKKEFGLLSLFGMTRVQLSRLIFYENTIISVLAIGIGIGLGILFSQLFFIAIGAVLDLQEPMQFIVAGKAVWMTFISFFLLFECIIAFSLFRVGRGRIVDLLKAAKQPKSLPVFSKWLVVVSILCLGGGYALAWFSGTFIILTMFPILFLVIVGTYFLFTQSSVAILRKLRRNRGLLYNHTNLLTISQMVYKLKDNARVLFTVAILSAVVLTASGTLYTFYQGMMDEIVVQTPHTISYTEQGTDRHEVVQPDKLEKTLSDHGEKVKYRDRVVGILGQVTEESGGQAVVGETPYIISNESYNELAKRLPDVEAFHVDSGETVVIAPFYMRNTEKEPLTDLHLIVGNDTITLSPEQVRTKAVLNQNVRFSSILVVNDKQFAQMAQSIADEHKIAYYGYELENWTQSLAAVDALQAQIPDDQQQYFLSRVQPFAQMKQIFALTLYVGVFVSILFFIAAGSMLYFKLFTEFEEDQAQYKALKRIGMTDGEMRKIATTQIGTLFFLPFTVGVVHAAFALKTLGDVLMVNVWKYGSIVIGIYFVMQLFYFLLSRHTYLRQMSKS